jgi:amino acid adenylation domain-containing protein/non-ribosomal peptide synthase protein (TIGR01720 family)
MTRDRGIEDIYSLGPLQQGMLFHRVYSEASRTYFVQGRLRLHGRIVATAFDQAWQVLLARHTALRTLFVWQGVKEPVQVVRTAESVQMPVVHRDLRDADPAAIAENLDRLLVADYAQGFDLGKAPLMRVTLAQVAEQDFVCVWSHEHLIVDGWSLALLLTEWMEVYRGLVEGVPASLPPAMPYRSFLAWLGKQDRTQAERYWRRALRGVSEASPAPLPERSEQLGGVGPGVGWGEHCTELAVAETELVARAARAYGVTLGTVVLAAWALLVARNTGSRSAVFGVTLATRPEDLAGADRAVGLFINSLPLCVSVEGDAETAAWLRDLQANLAEVRQYGHSALSDIRQWSELGAQAAHHALFNSLVVFENYPLGQALDNPGAPLRAELLQLPSGSAALQLSAERNNVPLTLVVAPGNALELRLAYAQATFAGHDVAQLLTDYARTLLTLAEGASAAGGRIQRFLEASPEAAVQQLHAWQPKSDQVDAVPPNVCAWFERVVDRDGAAPALAFADRVLSYRELDARVQQLAHWLEPRLQRAEQEGRARRVALCLPRSAAGVIAILATLRAGAAYVPLDPEWPVPRLARVIADARPALVLSESGAPAAFQETDQTGGESGAPWFALSVIAAAASEESAIRLSTPIAPGAAAYVIYTSGSSGTPKGVVVSHRALVQYLRGLGEALHFEPGLHFGLLSSSVTDLGHTSLFGAFAFAGCLHVLEAEVALNGAAFAVYCEERPLDVIKITPTQLRLLLDQEQPERALPRRLLILGGEPLSQALIEELSRLRSRSGKSCRWVNHYGPTETTVGVLCNPTLEVTESPAVAGERATGVCPIGRALSAARTYVLGRTLGLLPAGAVGELAVGGATLADGYLGDPARTASRFLPDPFSSTPGSRMYRTGDLGRYLPDGRVVCLGRTDQQVKIHGHRVEPEEVAAVLREHPGLSAAAARVVVAGDMAQVVAYSVARAAPVETEELRLWCAARLPAHLMPAHFVALTALPLTPSGKLDVQALPSPAAPVSDGGGPPETELERILEGLWREVLGVAKVGRDNNFFELGGDSIKSLMLVARARRRELKLTPKLVFEHPTIARLADWLSRGTAESQPAVDREDHNLAPLSPIQHWYFAIQAGLGAAELSQWNQCLLLTVPAALDAVRFELALQRCVERHAALRLRFAADSSGTWQQSIAPVATARVQLERVSLRDGEQAEARARIEQRVELLQSELDIVRGPVFKAVHFDLGSAPGRLALVAHHLVTDVVSWRVLLGDLEHAYVHTAPLPPATNPVQWARHWEKIAESAPPLGDLPYWAACGQARLPRDSAATPEQNRMVSRQSVRRALSDELSAQLAMSLRAPHSVALDDVVLNAVAGALCAWSGRSAVTIECEGHGRVLPDWALQSAPDATSAVGWFTWRYPLRLSATSGPADEQLRATQAQRGAAPSGASYGLLRFVHQGAESESLRSSSEAEVSYNNLGQLDDFLPAGGLFGWASEVVRGQRHPHSRRSQIVEVTVATHQGQLEVEWAYSSELHSRATIERLADDALARLAAHAERLGAGQNAKRVGLGWRQLEPDERAEFAGVEGLYELSALQAGLLFHGMLGGGVYRNQLSLSLRGLDATALERAWRALAERHDVLRMRFVWEVGTGGTRRVLERPLAVVERAIELNWEILDYRNLSSDEQTNRWKALLHADRTVGYGLNRAPLWRVVVAELGDGISRMLWSREHVLLDGWSSGRLLTELLAEYARGATLPPLSEGEPGGFGQYLDWLQTRDTGAGRAYFRRILAGTEVTALPHLGGPAESVAQAAAGRSRVELGQDESDLLRTFAASRGLTLSTLCQAAWALVLGRYAATRDVTYGVTVSGRPAEFSGVERRVGLFINTLPLRVTLPGEAHVESWLHHLQARNTELWQHELTPLHELQADHGFGGRGLFDSVVVFENYPLETGLAQKWSGVQVLAVDNREETHYALTLVIVPGSRVRVELWHRVDRYTPPQGEVLLQQYLTVLRSLPTSTRLAEIGLSGVEPSAADGEAAGLIPYVDKTALDPSLSVAFERQVATRGDAIALRDGRETWSYRQLNSQAERVARVLQDLGVGVEDRIALCLDRSARQVVAILGVLKAGACYVPMEVKLPMSRRELMVRDAGVKVVLSEADLWLGAETDARILTWSELNVESGDERSDDKVGEVGAEARRRAPGNADTLAYVIYTSGSTGVPKGVGISHAQVLRLFRASERDFDFSARDVWSLFHSYAFDFSVWEIWGALLYGGQLVIVPERTTRDLAEFLQLLEAERVTVLNQTPSAFYALTDVALAQGALGNTATRLALRAVIFGGEALDERRVASWLQLSPEQGPKLVNMYGITETTVHVTVHALPRTVALSSSTEATGSAIGTPLSDLAVRVVDCDGNTAPPGAVGEMWVSGAGVGRGYLGRPALTALRFVPDPASPLPGARAYRSGDRARRLLSGELEYLGRADHQVKVRGHRIELGEIAHTLRGHREVAQAEVLLISARQRGPELVAFVVPRANEGTTLTDPGGGERALGAELKAYLSERLPSVMLPGAFLCLSELPRTVNGKLDRAALQELARTRARLPAPTSEAPATETERRLVDLWSQLLNWSEVGVLDDFFELGGHSLLLTRLGATLNLDFGVQLSLEQLLGAPSVRELARLIDATRAAAAPLPEAVVILPRRHRRPLSGNS